MLSLFISRGRLEARQKKLPRLRPGWAVVRVRLAGICNTDVELLRGYHGFQGTPGHEFVGEVTRCEERAWLGRRVVGEINIACPAFAGEECRFCRSGLRTHCQRRRVLGILKHDGAFAEYLTLPLTNLHPVPRGLTDEEAVFTEPLAAACEVLEQVRVRRQQEAAVLGDGKLAQLIARVLRVEGLRVTLVGRHRAKLALARRAGIATRLVQPAAAARRMPSRKWPLVVEATGSPEGLEQALALTEPRGTLVLKSTFHGAARLETWPIVVHEVRVVGSRCGPFPRALELLRTGRVDPRPLIAGIFPLSQGPEAMTYAQRPGVLKVLLRA